MDQIKAACAIATKARRRGERNRQPWPWNSGFFGDLVVITYQATETSRLDNENLTNKKKDQGAMIFQLDIIGNKQHRLMFPHEVS